MSSPSAPLLLTAAAVLGLSAVLLWRHRGRRREWIPAGTLSAILVYPLKSGAGTRCQRARVTAVGVRAGQTLDRSLAVVCNDTILCAMSRRRIVLIAARFGDDDVTLSAPGMTSLTVRLPAEDAADATVVNGQQFGTHNAGLDLGDVAGKWLGEYFADGKTYTLMFFRSGSVPARRTVDIPKPYAHYAKSTDIAAFQNVAALSIICQSSLEELNARMETPVTLDNFRMNLVISDAPAFEDDRWAFVRIGNAEMRRIKANNRCGTTCVNPQTAERSDQMEPLKTLRTFRLAKTKEERLMYKDSPLMGSVLGVDVEGDIAVGDTVYVIRK